MSTPPPLARPPVSEPTITAFREVPRTGVIYVTTEAKKRGFEPTDPDWCNLGQGMPEAEELPGAPPRRSAVAIDPADQEYAPVSGIWELREAIASLYNQLFRRGLPSQYSADNVAISGGGRTALTRVAASLGHVNLGHFLPDYTAYEELLDVFRLFSPIPILLESERGYAFTAADLRREVSGRGLGAVLLSNPSNPTGKVIGGDDPGRVGGGGARRSTAPSSSTSSTRTTCGGPTWRPRVGSRPRPATSRTSIAIRW
jgi:N-succinyldiaminopimelate aminotransferase